jgi:hypothetical protein
MQLPSIDRIQSVRPVAAEAAALTTGRVVPVVPVNPPATPVAAAPAEASPSVINLISQGDKSNSGDAVYSNLADPVRQTSKEASVKDWTIKRPEIEKTETPPPEPIAKILMEQIKSLWQASASAVQVQDQVKNQLDPSRDGIHANPGLLSTEVYTYSPTKINKTDKTQT